MNHRFSKTLLALAVALPAILPAPAQASAWTQEKGKGQVIVTGLYSNSDKGLDADGESVEIDDYRKAEAYLLVEYGLTDDLTLMATPSFRHVEIKGRGDDTTGLGYTELGARYRAAQGDNWVLSFQGSARIPGERRDDNLAQVGSVDSEYDLRALVGSSFKIAEMDAFLDVQAGYRFRDGEPPNEYRGDITFGLRPASRLLLLGQIFNTVSDGRGQGVFTDYHYHNAQLSAVVDLDDRWSIQFGGLATLGGRNALRERGFTTGLWLRF